MQNTEYIPAGTIGHRRTFHTTPVFQKLVKINNARKQAGMPSVFEECDFQKLCSSPESVKRGREAQVFTTNAGVVFPALDGTDTAIAVKALNAAHAATSADEDGVFATINVIHDGKLFFVEYLHPDALIFRVTFDGYIN